MNVPDYYCKNCGKEVFVADGVITRPCGHDNETVIAERRVILYGESHLKETPLLDRVTKAINSLIKSFRGS